MPKASLMGFVVYFWQSVAVALLTIVPLVLGAFGLMELHERYTERKGRKP